MGNSKININANSLKDFLENGHNIPNVDEFCKNDMEIFLDENLLQDIVKIIMLNATPLLSTEMKNGRDIFLYLTKYYNKTFKKYSSNDEYILFILNILGISLSNFSDNSYTFLAYIYEEIEEFKSFKDEANSYIESKDLRGLLFWLTNELKIDYDSVIDQFIYSYSPPNRTTGWIKKNRKDVEPIEFWFDKTSLGKSLFVVLYTVKCRYSNCLGCILPNKSAEPEESSTDIFKNQKKIYDQIDYLYNHTSYKEKNDIKELTLSNNGNLYDTETMPFLSLLYIVDKSIQNLPNLKKIVLESRIEVIEIEKLKILKDTIDKHQKKIILETAVGLEIMDDNLRNGYYRKGLSREEIEGFLKRNDDIMKNNQNKDENTKKAKKCKQFFEGELKYSTPRSKIDKDKLGKLSVKFYMMYMCIPYEFDLDKKDKNNCTTEKKVSLKNYIKVLEPKDTTLKELIKKEYDKENKQIAQVFGIYDIKNAIEYFKEFKNKFKNIDINLHINPTYLTEKLEKKKEKGLLYDTPNLEDIKELLKELLKLKIDNIGCFISTNDEGLSEEKNKEENFNERRILNDAIHEFNQKNYEKSEEILKKLN